MYFDVIYLLPSPDIVVSHLSDTNTLDGNTVYHIAVQGSYYTQKLLDILIAADGYPINHQNDQGLSALHLACQTDNKKIVQFICVSYLDFL